MMPPLPRSKCFGAVFVAAGILGAAPRLMSAQAGWTVATTPMLTIGAGDGPDQELNRVGGAIRLADGRVVVANGKPLELRVYSPKGAFLSRIGRAGNGPGEFGYEIDLVAASADSVVIFTPSARWEVFRLDGRLLHEWTGTYAGRPQTTFYRRAYTRPIGVGIGVCTRRFLESLPAPVLSTPALREVFSDEGGRYWVKTYRDTSPWTVYSRGGRVLGTVILPTGFELYQVGADFVTGRMRDADDVEEVVVYRLNVPAGARLAASPDCAARADSIPPVVSAERASAFRATLRNVETANEAFFSDRAQYARTADELHVDVPSGAQLRVLRGEKYGYVVGVFDLKTNYFCAVGVGAPTPPGWGDGTLRCGD